MSINMDLLAGRINAEVDSIGIESIDYVACGGGCSRGSDAPAACECVSLLAWLTYLTLAKQDSRGCAAARHNTELSGRGGTNPLWQRLSNGMQIKGDNMRSLENSINKQGVEETLKLLIRASEHLIGIESSSWMALGAVGLISLHSNTTHKCTQ